MLNQNNRRQLILGFIGSLGITLSFLCAVWVQFSVFIHPETRFGSSKYDLWWAVFFAIASVAGVILVILRRQNVLRRLMALLGILLGLLLIFTHFIDILVLVWISTVSLGIGEWVQKKMRTNDTSGVLQCLITDFTVGISVLMVGMLVLGVFQLFYPVLIIVLMVVLIAFSIFSLRDFYVRKAVGIKCLVKRLAEFEYRGLLALFLFLSLFATLTWALAPAIRYDSATYHVAVPEIFTAKHGMVEIPETYQSYWAHYIELFYVLGIILGSKVSPALLHFMAYVGCIASTYLIGSRIANKSAGFIGAFLVACLPILNFEAGTAYIELFACLLFSTMFLMILDWLEVGGNQRLIMIGFFSGMAIGVKLNALVLLIPVFVFFAIFFIYKFRFSAKMVQAYLCLFLPVLVFWMPWLLREYYWTGNPVFPNFNNIFHSNKWFSGGLFSDVSVNSSKIFRFILFPFELIFSNKYYHEAPGGMFGILPFAFFPWLYSWHPAVDTRHKRILLVVFCYILLAVFLLLLVTSLARYLIPLFPLVAVLSGMNMSLLWMSLSKSWQRVAFLSIVFVYFFSTRLSLTVRNWEIPERYPVRLLFNLESDQEFLRRAMPVYNAFEYLNQQGDGAHKVFSLGNELRLYSDSAIYGPLQSKEAYELFHNPGTPDELARSLEQGGFEYLLYYPPEVQYRKNVYQSSALNEDFFRTFTRLEFVKNQFLVYRLGKTARTAAELFPENLLDNGGFEMVDSQDKPAYWSVIGDSQGIWDTGASRSGRRAIRLEGLSSLVIYQDVPVQPGGFYSLCTWVQSGTPDQVLQIYIDWLDSQETTIQRSADWSDITGNWTLHRLTDQAPLEAAAARVYLSLSSDGWAAFDDVSLSASDVCPQE